MKSDPSCSSLFVGFADGVVRHLSIIKNNQRSNRKKKNISEVSFHLQQVFKPHTKPVTCMGIDGTGKMLATGVSHFCIMFTDNSSKRSKFL